MRTRSPLRAGGRPPGFFQKLSRRVGRLIIFTRPGRRFGAPHFHEVIFLRPGRRFRGALFGRQIFNVLTDPFRNLFADPVAASRLRSPARTFSKIESPSRSTNYCYPPWPSLWSTSFSRSDFPSPRPPFPGRPFRPPIFQRTDRPFSQLLCGLGRRFALAVARPEFFQN